MARRAGEGLLWDDDIATGGLLIRHLVLWGLVDNSITALDLICAYLSKNVALSVMSQYTPIPALKRAPLPGRRVTRRECETIVDRTLTLGFENIYIRNVNGCHLSPDCRQEKPFQGH